MGAEASLDGALRVLTQKAFAPHRAEIAADVANYTDIVPVVQISEIIAA